MAFADSANTIISRQAVSGAAVTDVAFTGLNGTTDLLYKLYYVIAPALAGEVNCSVQINGADVGGGSQFVFDGLTMTTASFANLIIATFDSSGIAVGEFIFNAIPFGLSSMRRGSAICSAATNGQAQVDRGVQYKYLWTIDASNITSMTVHCDTVGGIGIGSYFTLCKV